LNKKPSKNRHLKLKKHPLMIRQRKLRQLQQLPLLPLLLLHLKLRIKLKKNLQLKTLMRLNQLKSPLLPNQRVLMS
jgi:hypothetical protein